MKCRTLRLLSRDNVLGILTWLGDERSGVRIRQRQWVLLFFKASRLSVGPTQSPVQWTPLFLSPVVERPGSEVNHSPSSSVKVENEWSFLYMPS